MKNKIIYITFIALFLSISLVLSVGMIFYGQSEAGANENLSNLPEIIDKEGKVNDYYFSDFSKFINDRFFLRQELISVNNMLSSKVLNSSGEDSIVLGKNNWLYYESTLNDFLGVDALTEREMFCVVNNLMLMSDYCESKCAGFAIMIAPNKNSLYPEFMPDAYPKTSASFNAKNLYKSLNKHNINNINIFNIFENQPILYYKTDSHWNIKGAALAADNINQAFGIKTDYYNDKFEIVKNGYTGDLYEMLYPAFKGGEDEILFKGELNYNYVTKNSKPDSILIKTTSDNKIGSIMVYRDSFGNILYPFIANSYSEATFSRSNNYNLTGDFSYYLIELVERNIATLIEKAPIMPSSSVEVVFDKVQGESLIIEKDKFNKNIKEYAYYSGKLLDNVADDSDVYIVTKNATYEAFLLKDGSYGAYIPEAEEVVSVAYKTKSNSFENHKITLKGE